MEKKFKKILSSIAVLILVLAMLPLSNIANEVAVEPDVVQPQQATKDEAAMPSEEEKKPAEEADNSMPQTQSTDETNQPAPAAEEAPRAAVGTSLDDWNYKEEGGKYILTKFKKTEWQDIVIPGKINGKPVALDNVAWPRNSLLPGSMNSLTIQAAEDGTKVGVVGDNLHRFFYNCTFKGKVDLRGLDTSNVTNFQEVFESTKGLTGIDVTGWDVSKGTNFQGTFKSSKTPSITGLETWNTESATDMRWMFYNMSQISEINIDNWNVGNVTNAQEMFKSYDTDNLTTISANNLSWNSATSLYHFFGYSDNLRTINVKNWYLPKVTDMRYFFFGVNEGATKAYGDRSQAATINADGWNFGTEIKDSVNLYQAQWYVKNLILNANDWDLGTREDWSGFNSLFYSNDYTLEQNINNLNAHGAKKMNNFASYHHNLDVLNANNWTLPNVTSMNNAFSGIQGTITTISAKNWNFSQTAKAENVLDMTRCFESDNTITSIDLTGWQGLNQNVNINYMFRYTNKLEYIDMTSFDQAKITNKTYAFWLGTLTPLTVVTNNEVLYDAKYNYKGDNRKAGQAIYRTNYGKWPDGTSTERRYDTSNVAITGSGDETTDTNPNVETPTREGYEFTGWEKSTYYNSVIYKAQWRKIAKYKVRYNANYGKFDTPVADQPYGENEDVTITDQVPTRDGYVFKGWTTQLRGVCDLNQKDINSDKSCTPNFTTSQVIQGGMPGAKDGQIITLYALWAPASYNIAFDANTGSGQMDPQKAVLNKSVKLNKNTLTKPGYKFANWNTKDDGSGTPYNDQANVRNLTTTDGATVTLYAQWTPVNYKIHFDANGGKGSMTDQTMTYDQAANLKTNSYRKDGYTFKGWATSPNGQVVYTDGKEVSNLTDQENGTFTLYAVWAGIEYQITYNKNADDATGTMANQPWAYDASVTLNPNQFSRPGWAFKGWSLTSTGKVQYRNQAIVTDNFDGTSALMKYILRVRGDVTLYAIWERVNETVLPGPDGVKPSPDDVTVQGPTVEGKPDGSVTLPEGGTVTPGQNAPQTNIPENSVVKPDGTVTTPGADKNPDTENDNVDVKPNPDGTITQPGPDGKLDTSTDNNIVKPNQGQADINPDGSITLPNGGTTKPGENAPEVNVPNGSTVKPDGTVNTPNGQTVKPKPDGTITLPGADGDINQDQDNPTVTPKPNGTQIPTITPEGGVTLPEGGTVKPGNGEPVTVPNGSTVNPDGTVTTPGADGKPGTTVKPNPDGTITLPGADGDINKDQDNPTVTPTPGATQKPTINPDGSVTLPEGGTVKPGNGEPVTVPNGSTVNPDGTVTTPGADGKPGTTVKPNPDGTITLPGADGDINKDQDNPTVTPTPGATQKPTINNDGSVTLPEGGTVTLPNGQPVTVPAGGKVNPDGTVTVPGADNTPGNGDDVTVKPTPEGGITVPGADGDINTPNDNVTVNPAPNGDKPTLNPDGTVTVPNGGTVTPGNGEPVTVPNGSTVNPDGTINTPNNGVVKPNPDGTITLPGADNNIKDPADNPTVAPKPGATQKPTINNDGSVTLPEGGTVTLPNGQPVTVPAGGKVNPDGTITVPGADNTPGNDDDVTVKPTPEGGITVPGTDGDINTPNDNVTVNPAPNGDKPTLNPDGTVTVPNGGTVTPGNGQPVTVPNGSTVNPDGTVNTPNNGVVKPNPDGTITLPGADNNIKDPADNPTVAPKPGATQKPTINPDGSVTLPEGGTVTLPGKDPIEAPNGSTVLPDGSIVGPHGQKVNPDGTITLPGADGDINTPNDNVTVTPNPNGTQKPIINPDGSVTLPEGGTVTLPNGETVNVPNGGTVKPDGTVKPTSQSSTPNKGDVAHTGISVNLGLVVVIAFAATALVAIRRRK